MIKQIDFPLQQGACIRLQGGFSGSTADLSRLARLMHIDTAPEVSADPDVAWIGLQDTPQGVCCVCQRKTLGIVYDPDQKMFRIYVHDTFRFDWLAAVVTLWQFTVMSGVTAGILRGKKVQLMHCSMLEKDGQALLLCGESGIGKSTTVRRWKDAGGTAVSDDVVMLEYLDDDILVHRLPTWSSCREAIEGKVYPFAPPLKLKNVLAISRAESIEGVEEVPWAEYYAQIYRCGFYHHMAVVENLPLEVRKQVTGVIRNFTDILLKRFKPKAFFAHLDGNIKDSLGVFL